MKYKKLTLSFTYEKYSEHETNNLSSYTKNKVYYSSGEFHIYVDVDKAEHGKQKLLKELGDKYKIVLDEINNTY